MPIHKDRLWHAMATSSETRDAVIAVVQAAEALGKRANIYHGDSQGEAVHLHMKDWNALGTALAALEAADADE